MGVNGGSTLAGKQSLFGADGEIPGRFCMAHSSLEDRDERGCIARLMSNVCFDCSKYSIQQ